MQYNVSEKRRKTLMEMRVKTSGKKSLKCASITTNRENNTWNSKNNNNGKWLLLFSFLFLFFNYWTLLFFFSFLFSNGRITINLRTKNVKNMRFQKRRIKKQQSWIIEKWNKSENTESNFTIFEEQGKILRIHLKEEE